MTESNTSANTTELIAPAEPPSPEVSAAPPRLALWLAGIALLAALGLTWLVWQGSERLEATRQELARRLTDSDSVQRETQANAKQNREALDALQAKVGALEARALEMQSQQLALETMYQELSRVREERLLAEIEQDVSLAVQQLQLAGNVEAALIVLQGADARLAKSGQPQFLPLRKLINRDIERLRALPSADVPGIAMKLEAILNIVPTLPLAYEQRPAPTIAVKPTAAVPLNTADAAIAVPPAPTFDWQAMARAWLADLWHEVRQLVRIERIDPQGIGDPGLLSPRETFFLRENLRLRLLSARLGLLARDGRSFQSDLKQAGEWLERYFDTRAPAVAEAQASLKKLTRQDLMHAPVELNETLAALRNFKLTRDRRTPH